MKVGFVGLGTMGSGMAANIQKAGHDLVVHDVRKDAALGYLERGARWAETARELAAHAEVVFTSLPTPADVERVAFGDDGLADGLRPGSAWFDLSTNSLEVVRRLEQRLAGQGVMFLDAPVSGGSQGAAAGKLAIWVGGDQASFARHRDVLGAVGDEVAYIGEIGAGTVAKLVHNMAVFAVHAVTAEVMTMGVKAGVDAAALWSAIRSGIAGRTRTFDLFGKTVLTGPADPPNLQLRLALKDAKLATQVGRDLDVPMALCELVTLQMVEGANLGWGSRDVSAALLLQNQRSGIAPFALTADEIERILGA